MKTIHGQVLASTGRDCHGQEIPENDLRDLFEQIPDPWLICDNHDPAKPPVSRAYNKRLDRLNDGTLVIRSDIDVFDESGFEKYGGASIAFTTNRLTMNPERKPDIEIVFNPLLFCREEIWELVRKSNDRLQIDAKELVQKAWDLPAIIFLTFACVECASGFFKCAGADLYAFIKQKLITFGRQIEQERDGDLRCNITFSIEHQGHGVEVLVSVRSADLDILEQRGVAVEHIVAHIRQATADRSVTKVVVQARGEEPLLYIDYFVDPDGNVHRPGV